MRRVDQSRAGAGGSPRRRARHLAAAIGASTLALTACSGSPGAPAAGPEGNAAVGCAMAEALPSDEAGIAYPTAIDALFGNLSGVPLEGFEELSAAAPESYSTLDGPERSYEPLIEGCQDRGFLDDPADISPAALTDYACGLIALAHDKVSSPDDLVPGTDFRLTSVASAAVLLLEPLAEEPGSTLTHGAERLWLSVTDGDFDGMVADLADVHDACEHR